MRTMVLGSNEQYKLFFQSVVVENQNNDFSANNTFHCGYSMYHDGKLFRHLQFDRIIFLQGFEDFYDKDRLEFYRTMQKKCPESTHSKFYSIFQKLIDLEQKLKNKRKRDIESIISQNLCNGTNPQPILDDFSRKKETEKLAKQVKDLLPNCEIEDKGSCIWINTPTNRFTLRYDKRFNEYTLFNTRSIKWTHNSSLDTIIALINNPT